MSLGSPFFFPFFHVCRALGTGAGGWRRPRERTSGLRTVWGTFALSSRSQGLTAQATQPWHCLSCSENAGQGTTEGTQLVVWAQQLLKCSFFCALSCPLNRHSCFRTCKVSTSSCAATLSPSCEASLSLSACLWASFLLLQVPLLLVLDLLVGPVQNSETLPLGMVQKGTQSQASAL